MPGVQLAVIELMLIQAKEYATYEEGEKIIAQLEYIKSGQSVPREWELETLERTYKGKLILTLKNEICSSLVMSKLRYPMVSVNIGYPVV